jgi:hypothetical protein
METKTHQFESLDSLVRKGTCIEFFSAYQDLDIDRMLSLCSPHGTVEFKPLGKDGTGKIYETGKGIWSALMDSFPDLDNTVKSQQYDEGSDSVTCHVVIFGKQQKDFAGIRTKGSGFESDHIFIFRFNPESKIENISIEWDHTSFVRQLTE